VMHDAILHHGFASPRSLNGEIPAGLERIIDRALQKDRDLRYQTAAQIQDDLLRLREPGSRRRRFPRLGLAAAAAAILIIVPTAVLRWRSAPATPRITDPRQRKLTNNSPDNPLQGQALISPDGKYLAYADRLGIHVQLIETGQTTTVPQPEGFDAKDSYWSIAAWFPSSKEFLVNARPATEDQNNGTAQGVSIWAVMLTGAPRKLREDAEASSVSPDGTWIAFGTRPGRIGGDREIWLMGPNGERPHKLLETSEDRLIAGPEWSQDGRHVVYLEGEPLESTGGLSEANVFSKELAGSSQIPLASWHGDPLMQLTWLRDGRILYLVKKRGYSDANCDLWQQRVDPRTGRAQERPARITNWDSVSIRSAPRQTQSDSHSSASSTRRISRLAILPPLAASTFLPSPSP
jgi:eukaryotic-like serine/threonine-protein kinase